MIEEKYYYHFFKKIFGLSTSLIKKTLEEYQNLKTAWEKIDALFLKQYLLFDEQKIRNFFINKNNLNLTEEIENLTKKQIRLITIKDENYPELLREIYDPPDILYTKGNIEMLSSILITVVGSRQYSSYGENATKYFVNKLNQYNIGVISGMARGIDSIAHCEALNNQAPNIAVLATNIDFPYPRSNKKLYDSLVSKGLVISENPFDNFIQPFLFPLRNRIMSGISIATLVIEANKNSGSIITARLALEQGREVFTIPGAYDNPYIHGNYQLIQNCQAYLVYEPEEIVEKLKETTLMNIRKISPGNSINQNLQKSLELNEKEQKIYDSLLERNLTINELSNSIKINLPELSIIISQLEIKDIIKVLPGGNLSLKQL
ncbi:MAG: protecting protein DprA protein [Candidatus Peregrinibacteria bacterium GW2011_GWA2_33_10]|nr:MAG: protecting protein DprA protein [Candidatus Peregrinibacteria bacterium GW2011_GWA2_33_10]KKP41100.1 MAG: protecting protein DprA, DNA processing protein [Candidatus Peregrinibacteria bacterium GW2011_GWC2_33_13]